MRKPQKPNPEYLARLETIKGFIMVFFNAHHYSPSTQEIADEFEVSTSVAAYWLRALEKSGWLEPREPGICRNIIPVAIFKDRPVFPVEKEQT